MSEIFLSASVPVVGRGRFVETADPFLIQIAVRELVAAIAGRFVMVWGGHPAITPMVWSVCEDSGVGYENAVILYQSRFFMDAFPEENRHFANTVAVDAIGADREASLLQLRRQMLSRPSLRAAVFIGGMDGVFEEYRLFREYHPNGIVLPLGAPGGAARELIETSRTPNRPSSISVDFAKIFREELLTQIE